MTNFDRKSCNRELPGTGGAAGFDNYIAKLKPGELFMLARRPGTGKTTRILNMILRHTDSSRVTFSAWK